MPFTPIHMGPGLAFKAIGGRHFSLMVFGFSQVGMDIEPFVRMLRGDLVIHAASHTFLGAGAVAVLSLLLGRPLCQWLLRLWNRSPRSGMLAKFQASEYISWPAAVAGAVIGAFSHLAFDSIMHADLQPWVPFFAGNGMLGLLSVEAIHQLCCVLGILGIAALARPVARRLCTKRTA
jgi:hypothetical protein